MNGRPASQQLAQAPPDDADQNISQLAGFQVAFNDYAADCARAARPV